MTDKPIIFSAQMVRALLEGRKTQTRRVLKPQPVPYLSWPRLRYAHGDRLWVKEAHYLTDDGDSEYAVYSEDQTAVAEHLESMARLQRSHPQVNWSKHLRLRPSIHMPRWASRLTLTVTDVRVQRLWEISEADAVAEGFASHPPGRSAQIQFHAIWNSLHGPAAWDANPWVWVKTFDVHLGNIDSIAGTDE